MVVDPTRLPDPTDDPDWCVAQDVDEAMRQADDTVWPLLRQRVEALVAAGCSPVEALAHVLDTSDWRRDLGAVDVTP